MENEATADTEKLKGAKLEKQEEALAIWIGQ
jgi:hypothetical protein